MSRQFTREFYLEVAEGKIPGYRLIHKFGAGALTSTMNPISQGMVYQTPQTAQSLEFVSDNAGDTSTGLGAQELTISGIGADGLELEITVATNGTTPVALSSDFLRIHRAYVSKSGTYATATTGSHLGILKVQSIGGVDLWLEIQIDPFPVGQSQIGVATIPIGHSSFLLSKNIFSESTKTADIYFFKREMVGDIVTPYDGIMRLVEREVGITGGYSLRTTAPKKLTDGTGPADIGFMGKVESGDSECSVEFELLIVDNNYL